MKVISDTRKKEFARRRKVKKALMAECPVNEKGAAICPRCNREPDYRGLQLAHKKSLAQGGRTTKKNCEILCARCHFGPDGHREEGMPKPKAVDRPRALAGYNVTLRAYPKEIQCGTSKRKER